MDDLLAEGQQWSRKLLKLETTGKQLRAETKVKDEQLATASAEASATAKMIDELNDRLRKKDEAEQGSGTSRPSTYSYVSLAVVVPGFVERIATLTAKLNDCNAELGRSTRASNLQDREKIDSVAVTERLEAKLKALQVTDFATSINTL